MARSALLCSVATATFATAAQAQADVPLVIQAPAASDRTVAQPDESGEQTVVVTGSRIRQPNLKSASPLQSLDAAAIARSGAIVPSDIINELPQFGSGFGNSSQSLDSSNSGFNSGVELVNLRNLGSKRTLVLVNGRRFVGGDPGTSSVDLSSLPTDMIERIDVVTGAASAVYGADAVSGVVNVVLRKGFEGARVIGRSGISSRGDAAEYYVSGLLGGKFQDGRGQALLGVEWFKQGGFLASDRAYGQADAANFTVSPLNGSSASAGGRVVANGVQYVFDANNNPVLASSIPLGQRLFQRLPTRTQQAPLERIVASFSGSYDLVEPHGDGFSASAYVEANYARVNSSIQYEPMSLFFDGTKVGTPSEGPNDAPRIPIDNPFLVRFANQVGVAPSSVTALNRRLSETGVRFTDTRRETFRVATGLQGQFTPRLRYDLYYQYGRVTGLQVDTGVVDRNRFFAGLFVNTNGTPGNFADDTCADPRYVALGCRPLNVFGANTVPQSYLDYAAIPSRSDTESSQHVVSGYLSADLFDLPGGRATLVGGGEYRSESTVISPAASYIDKSNSTRFLNGARGRYDVTEQFAELQLPLLADRPFAQLLTLGAAARHSRYSTVGSKFTYSGRAEWAPVRAIRFRGVYSTAIRAPNINELYSPLSSVNSSIFDPCDSVNDTGGAIALTGNRLANCRTALGANFTAFDQTQNQRGTVQTQSVGDPDLDAEKAKTFTVGGVLTPGGWLRGASLTVDYYNIKITNVISALAVQDVVNQCYDQSGLPAVFCNNVIRSAATGQLFAVRNPLFNAATEKVTGIDAQFAYGTTLDRLAEGLPGRLDLQVSWSRLLKHDFLARAGVAVDRRRGQVGDFKHRVTANLGYSVGGFRFAVVERYLSKVVADTTIPTTAPFYDLSRLPARWYTDLQIGHVFAAQRLGLTLGVKNVFDADPPINTTPSRTVVNGSSVSGNVYDVRGRFLYASASIKF